RRARGKGARRAASGRRSPRPGGGRTRPGCSALGGVGLRRPGAGSAHGCERRLRLVDDQLERLRVRHGQVGEHLAVELDARLSAAGHELVVREPLASRGRVDADDPQTSEVPLLRLAVAVGVDERVLDLLLRPPVAGVLLAPVAARLLEDLAALLARVDRTLDAGHQRLPSSRLTFGALASETGSALLNARLRFADFFSRLWLFIACRRRSLPAPVTL